MPTLKFTLTPAQAATLQALNDLIFGYWSPTEAGTSPDGLAGLGHDQTLLTLDQLIGMRLARRGEFTGEPITPNGLTWEITAAGRKQLELLMATNLPPEQRQAEIQAELATLGFRMEASLSTLDGDDGSGDDGTGHAVMRIEGDECIDDEELNGNARVLALASEWSRIENAELTPSTPKDRQGQS